MLLYYKLVVYVQYEKPSSAGRAAIVFIQCEGQRKQVADRWVKDNRTEKTHTVFMATHAGK